MAGAHFRINQAANPIPTGTDDLARIDVWQLRAVHFVGVSSGGQTSPQFTILSWPLGSARTQPSNSATFDATYTPDVPGSYLIEFVVDNGVGANLKRMVMGVTRDTNGLIIDNDIREPAFGELEGDDNCNTNDRGWAKAYEDTIAGQVPAVNSVAALLLRRASRHKHVHLLGYYTPGDGGGGDIYWDATSTSAHDYGTIFQPGFGTGAALATGRWVRRFTGPVYVEWFGAVADVVETTAATTVATRTIAVSHSDALKAKVGQTLWIRAAYSHGNYTVLALTGVQTGYDAASPAGSRNYPVGWPAHGAGTDPFPYDISTTAAVADQLLVSPKHLHRYIEIPSIGYRGYVSDIGGPEMSGIRRSPMGFDTNTEKVFRLSENLNDGNDPTAGESMTATLGADNLIATITAVDTTLNTITWAGGDPAAGATFVKADVCFFTDSSAAFTRALAAADDVRLASKVGCRSFTVSLNSKTFKWVRKGQIFLAGTFTTNGNRCTWQGNTPHLPGPGDDTDTPRGGVPEIVDLGQIKTVAFQQAAGTGGAIQQCAGDLAMHICFWNKYLTPHKIGWQAGMYLDGIGSYGPGGASWYGLSFMDYHAGAGIGFYNSQATQQCYAEGFKFTPTNQTQNGSGGNLGRGVAFISGTFGLGGCTATWCRNFSVQGFPVQYNIRSADTTEFCNSTGEDLTAIGAVVYKIEFANRFDQGGDHFEDTGLFGRWIDPRANINRNRFMVLGQAQSNAHAQFAAGAPINVSTGFNIDRGPRRLKVTFGAGTIAAGSVTVTGTDYCGDPLSETYTPTAGVHGSPSTIEGDGRKLFDTVTLITSTVNMGVTVDVLQAGATVLDANAHNNHRVAGVGVVYERINCDSFTSEHNGITLVNESAAYPAVYFLATDGSNNLSRVRLNDPNLGRNVHGIMLADASYNPVATVAGLEYMASANIGNEFPPLVDGVSRPQLKLAGTVCHAGGTGDFALIFDSRRSDGVQQVNGHFKGLWEFDSVGKFNAGATIVGNLTGSGGSLFWHDAGIPEIFVVDTSGLFILPEHDAVASGNPYGDGSNVVQRTVFLYRNKFWDPDSGLTNKSTNLDFSGFLTFTNRATTSLTPNGPYWHYDFALGTFSFSFFNDANGQALGLGGNAQKIRWGAGVPNFADVFGSLYLRTDGNAGATLYVNEGAGAAGTGNNWIPK